MKDQDMSKKTEGKPDEQQQNLREQIEALQKEIVAREKELKELRAINEDNRDFYENAPLGFHVTDENGLILKMNKTELDRLGYTREEMEGKLHVLDILSEKSKILFYKYIPIYRDKGKLDLVDVEYLKKDGGLLMMNISIRANYDEHGNFKGANTYLWDISDRDIAEKEMMKVTERYVQAKQVIEEKNAVLDKLNLEIQELKVVHEELGKGVTTHIRQPLENALAICIKLIEDPSFSPDDQKKMLADLYKSIQNVESFLDSFKGMERTGMENTHLEMSRFSLSALLVDIVNRLEPTAKKKDLTLTLEIYKEYWLEADRNFMMQILDLMVLNAITVTQAGAEIVLNLTEETGKYLIDIQLNAPEKKLATTGRMYPAKERPFEPEAHEGLNLDVVETLAAKLGYELIVHVPDHTGLLRLIIPLKS